MKPPPPPLPPLARLLAGKNWLFSNSQPSVTRGRSTLKKHMITEAVSQRFCYEWAAHASAELVLPATFYRLISPPQRGRAKVVTETRGYPGIHVDDRYVSEEVRRGRRWGCRVLRCNEAAPRSDALCSSIFCRLRYLFVTCEPRRSLYEHREKLTMLPSY